MLTADRSLTNCDKNYTSDEIIVLTYKTVGFLISLPTCMSFDPGVDQSHTSCSENLYIGVTQQAMIVAMQFAP